MSTQLSMGYLAGETLNHVLQTQIQVWKTGNRDYMQFPQGGVQE
jgi:hypothetical protein